MLRAGAGTLAVLIIPGALVASLLRLRFRSVATWAAIPGFSLAAVFAVAQGLDLVGVSFNVASTLVCGGVLAAAAIAVELARRRGTQPAAEPASARDARAAGDARLFERR